MFSVIIPLFNKEVTIAVTLNSVLNQSFTDFEIIVINDGSTDNSLYVVNSFKDSRIKVISQENKGVSMARNLAIKEAEYDYIAFLDADDVWSPDYLKEITHLIRKYPECSVYTVAYRVIGQNKTSVKCEKLPEGIIEDYFEARFKHHIMRTSTIVVNKKVFDCVGGFPEGMIGGEDDYTWAKIALKFKIAFTPKILATYDNRNSTFYLRRGQMDTCQESWLDFYEPDNFYRNEFIASKAITAGIRYAYGTRQRKSLCIEKSTAYTTLSKSRWRYLYFLNRTPYFLILFIKVLIPFYKRNKYWLGKKKHLLKNKLSRVLLYISFYLFLAYSQEFSLNTGL